ncbi:MAG: CheR family methyltransferase [Syntrophobacteraceae bacterium]|nr:CheR family methyltransferase [Syntrophobacteraceae bacterium]
MSGKEEKKSKAGKKDLPPHQEESRGEEANNGGEISQEVRVVVERLEELAQPAPKEDKPAGEGKTSDKKPFPIVGIGASAGGLEALEEFFQNVPKGSGIAYVVISHTDPARSSLLPEIIQRRSNIPVVEVKEGMPAEPNRVYLPPSNRDLEIEGESFRLKEQKRGATLRLPIDKFFKSLAEARREQACCVILSGTGADGTQGLRVLKEKGGMMMVQSTASAKYEGMPESAIGTGLADFILAPSEMPERIIEYFHAGPGVSKPEEAEEQEDFSATLSKIITIFANRKGHDFSAYKKSTLVRRIQRRMAVTRVHTSQQYLKYLHLNPGEIDALFQDLLIGVTSFFRDPEAFNFLKKEILPSLLAHRSEHEPFRVWAAGCATGEEVYSIVILLMECLDELGIRKELQVFGTDLDQPAIEKARNGRYPENIAADLTPQRLERFFQKESSGFEVRKIVREPVVFAAHNVLEAPPFSRLDLLVCRNLLIYLESRAQKKIMPLFHYALKPDGVLFLGTSETIGEFTDLFTSVSKRWSVYRRIDVGPALQPTVEFPMRGKGVVQAPGQPLLEPSDMAVAEATSRLILEMHSPPCVVVNRRGEISYIHGRTGKYLEHATGRMSVNVVDMAREGLRFELASALRNVVTDGQMVRRDGLRVKTNGGFQDFNLVVKLLGKPESIKNMVVIIFEEIPQTPKPRRKKSGVPDAVTERTLELEREIARLQQDHRTAMEELETSNEELKSVNEELQSSNEELQSTNEELESSREELQSLNEELSTVNAQLHEKILEISHSYETINHVLNATGIAILFVDRDLNVLRFTREATNLVSLIDADIGRSLTHISTHFDYDSFFNDIRKAITRYGVKEMEIITRQGRYYWTKIVPYRDPGGQVSGAVITFTENESGEGRRGPQP